MCCSCAFCAACTPDTQVLPDCHVLQVTADLEPVPGLTWASTYVKISVLEQMVRRGNLLGQGFVEWCEKVPQAGGTGGYVSQGVSVRSLIFGGTFLFRDLRSFVNVLLPSMRKLPPLLPVPYDDSQELAQLIGWLGNVPDMFSSVHFKGLLCIAAKANQPAVDHVALIPAADASSVDILPLQSTTSLRHPVPYRHWNELRRTTGDRIYFSVPPRSFYEFPVQEWQTPVAAGVSAGGPQQQFALTRFSGPNTYQESMTASGLPSSNLPSLPAVSESPTDVRKMPGYKVALQTLAKEHGLSIMRKSTATLRLELKKGNIDSDLTLYSALVEAMHSGKAGEEGSSGSGGGEDSHELENGDEAESDD